MKLEEILDVDEVEELTPDQLEKAIKYLGEIDENDEDAVEKADDFVPSMMFPINEMEKQVDTQQDGKEKNSFAESRARLFETGSEFSPATKEEIVGIDNVLDRIDEVIHWLRNSEAYSEHKARLEPGIIFEGYPGTGKTLVSRYIAGESNSLFIDVRTFQRKGVFTDKDVADLFRLARETYAKTTRPVILFWDEFEGSARERSRADTNTAAVVSQLTAELDGVNGKMQGILLIGCTNYANSIDAALMRSGRMGLHISFNAPDRQGKVRLLDHYLGKVSYDKEADTDTLSYFFNEYDTAATIEESVQEAWRVAVRRFINDHREGDHPFITQDDLLEIFLGRLIGPPSTHSQLSGETIRRVATHEVGHAIAAVTYGVPLRLITIRQGKDSLGKVMTYSADHRTGTISELLNQLRVGVGGIIAEEIMGLPRTTGSWADTKTMTEIASSIVEKQGGRDRTGIFNPDGVGRTHYGLSISQKVAEEFDQEIRAMLNEARQDVHAKFIEYGSKVIDGLVDSLLERETMTGAQFSSRVKELTNPS